MLRNVGANGIHPVFAGGSKRLNHGFNGLGDDTDGGFFGVA